MIDSADAKPWEKRAEWASGRIAGSNPLATIAIVWIFALIWSSLSGLGSWSIFSGHYRTINNQSEMPVLLQGLFGIVFPLIGVGLVIFAVRATRRALRFGQSLLLLDSVPGVPGGTLSGTIDCAVSPELEADFDLRLSCEQIWYSFSGGNGSRERHSLVLWSDDFSCAGEPSGDATDRSSVPVHFAIPVDAHPCGPYDKGEVQWNLHVSSRLPGLDYSDDFSVPVFMGAPQPTAVARVYRAPSSEVRHPVHGRVRLGESGETLQVVFPPALNPGLALLPTIAAVIAVCSAWSCLISDHEVFAALAAITAIPFIYGAFRAWFLRTTVTVSPFTLSIERSLLFLRWRRDIDAQQIQAIASVASGNMGHERLYKVQVVQLQGASKIGSLLRSRSEAEHIRALMMAHLRKGKAPQRGTSATAPR